MPNLQAREDHAGLVEAQRDLYKCMSADPWFQLNKRIQEMYTIDMSEDPEGVAEVEKLPKLLKKIKMTTNRANQIIEADRISQNCEWSRENKERLKRKEKA